MASTIKVDEILDSQGNQFDGSQLGNVGKILNVYNVVCSTTVATTSTVPLDIPETITLTPISANSKFLLTAIVHHYTQDSGTGWSAARYNFKRNGTILRNTDDYGSGKVSTVNTRTMMAVPLEYLDSPNTTSSITYKTQVRTRNGYVNEFNQYGYGSFTIYEIGA